MNLRLIKQPTYSLVIPEKIFNNLLANIRKTDLEITFILSISRSKLNNTLFEANDCLYPPQWNEPAESKTIDSDYPKWCMDRIKEKKAINGHGHSHPKMGVTPSGYDNTFFNQIIEDTNTFQFRLIANQKGNIKCDVIDKENNIIVENMDVIVPCSGFNIITSTSNIKFEITNPKDITLESISPDLVITLKSTYLSVTKDTIINSTVPKHELLNVKRRNETNERIKQNTYKTYTNKLDMFSYEGYDYDEYMKNYDLERGLNNGYKK